MRPRSVIGPMLLIAIGGLLLANTLRPELPLIDVLATYWPFLLIGWGVLRLAEIVVWRVRSRPLPASGVTGGEWTLIVFLCLAGSSLSWVHHQRPWQRFGPFAARRLEIFGRQYDFAIAEQQKAAGKAPRILIENLRGNVRVAGADTDQIRASGRKTVRALEERDAEQVNQQSPLEVTGTGEQFVVRTNQDRVTGEHRVSADLEITVPRGASVEGRGRYGDFEITDLEGAVEINSDNAGVRLRNVGGNVLVKLRRSDLVRAAKVKGTVEVSAQRGDDLELEEIQGPVTIEGLYSGHLRFANLARPLRIESPFTTLRVERVTGQIQMNLGDFTGTQLVGPIRFTCSKARDVQIDGFSAGLEISMEGGDVTLRPAQLPLAAMQVETRSGNIELALPESAGFELKARTGRGSVANDFGAALKEESEGQHAATLSGAVGTGPLVSLRTGRGTVTVRKDSGAALQPPQEKKRDRIEIEAGEGRIRIQKH